MKKYIFYLIIQFAIICLTLSCSKKDNVIVYVAGYEKNDNKRIAIIWINGKAENLSDSLTSTIANSIYVSNNNVYVVGRAIEGQYTAKLWINGIGKSLSNGKTFAKANSVFISGSDILIAGFDRRNLFDGAIYWKNDKAIVLSDGYEANSIAALGKDIYVVGCSWSDFGFYSVAKMWKNGKGINLTDQKDPSWANSICISGKDIYIAGGEVDVNGRTIVKIWKNGKAINLTDGEFAAVANSIYVSGDDVYVAGWRYKDMFRDGKKSAVYWKNGDLIQLSDSKYNTIANSIFVLGDDVYVAGYKDGIATYWKNGKAVYLTGGKHEAEAMSIYVVNNE